MEGDYGMRGEYGGAYNDYGGTVRGEYDMYIMHLRIAGWALNRRTVTT